MQIDIFHDTVCPWCRIGKKNLMDAVKQLSTIEFTFRMRPFYLDPNMPEQGKPFREHMVQNFGDVTSLEPMFEQVKKAGEAAGLSFQFDKITRAPNTGLSHQWIRVAEGKQQIELAEAIYTAYFEDGLDIGDQNTLFQIAEAVGLDADGMSKQVNTPVLQKQLGEDLAYAHRIGLSGVPFFLINEKYGITGARSAESFIQAIEQIHQEKLKDI